MVLRFVDDWRVKQIISKLTLLAKKFDRRKCCSPTCGIFINRALGIPSHLIIAAMHDRASVNA